MLELIEMLALAISAVIFGAFAFAGILFVLDKLICLLAFCFVKVFIDRNATLNEFQHVWKITQGLK